MLSSNSIKMQARDTLRRAAKRKKKTKDPLRSYLSTCVAKVVANRNVGNDEQAKHWAEQLVKQLKVLGLVP